MRISRALSAAVVAVAMIVPAGVGGASPRGDTGEHQAGFAGPRAAGDAMQLPGERLAGGDRYATAAAIAEASFPDDAPLVYLARADVPVDALAAGTLTDGPILLSPQCGTLPDVVRSYVRAHATTDVMVLGGEAAVCSDIVKSLEGEGLKVQRLAGSTRYLTAVAISKRSFPNGSWVAYIGSGGSTSPDAVAGGSLTDGPILTVPKDGPIPPEVRDELRRLDVDEIAVLGGEGAVSKAVADELAAIAKVVRVAGGDRYATAAAIARRAFPTSPANVFLARGDVFVDAVAGGSLVGGPVLLTPSCGELPADVVAYLDDAPPLRVVALGGGTAVCDDLLDAGATKVQTVTAADAQPGDTEAYVVPADVVLAPGVHVLDPAWIVDVDAGSVGLDRAEVPQARSWQPGDVLVLAVDDTYPQGLLRRVVGVSSTANVITFTTEEAELTDAVLGGTVTTTAPLYGALQPGDQIELEGGQLITAEPADDETARTGLASRAVGSRAAARIPGSLSVSFDASEDRQVEFGGATVRGELDLDLDLEMKVVVAIPLSFRPRPRLESYDASVSLAQSADLSVTWTQAAGGEEKRKLTQAPVPLGTFWVMVGPVPVPITTSLDLEAGASWSGEARVTVGAHQEFDRRFDVGWRKGDGWSSSISGSGLTATGPTGSYHATVHADAWVRAEVRALAFDAVGPTVSAKAFVDGQIDWDSDPAARSGHIDVGVEPGIGAQANVPLFGRELGSHDFHPLAPFTRRLWEYEEGDEIEPGDGDVRATLTWDTEQDLDLHVIEPSGFEIYYADPVSPTGGELDLDANAACYDVEDRPGGLENIFWPEYSAPGGEYSVIVDEYDNCGAPTPPYRLQVFVDGVSVIDVSRTGGAAWTFDVGGGRASNVRMSTPAPRRSASK